MQSKGRLPTAERPAELVARCAKARYACENLNDNNACCGVAVEKPPEGEDIIGGRAGARP